MTTPCLSMDTVPHSTPHTCTHSHSQHTTIHAHTQCPHPSPHTLHQDCMNACMHTCVPTWRWAWQEGEWRKREEGSCPHLDLHLDLQVGPVDGEQRAVRAGGAQLPGTVGHVPVAVSQEDQWGEGGDLAGEIAFVFCVSPKDHTSLVVVGKVCHPNSDPLLHCHQPTMGCPRYTR